MRVYVLTGNRDTGFKILGIFATLERAKWCGRDFYECNQRRAGLKPKENTMWCHRNNGTIVYGLLENTDFGMHDKHLVEICSVKTFNVLK